MPPVNPKGSLKFFTTFIPPTVIVLIYDLILIVFTFRSRQSLPYSVNLTRKLPLFFAYFSHHYKAQTSTFNGLL